MTQISLNSSSFVGRQCGYGPQSNWDACVEAVNAYYRPENTFAERFEKMLLEVKHMGFDALDIWTAGQMNWRWTTEKQMAQARTLLRRFVQSSDWHLPYFIPALVGCTPVGGWVGALVRRIKDPGSPPNVETAAPSGAERDAGARQRGM